MSPLPDQNDLDRIGTLLRRTVPPEYEDLNGHVNVGRHYQMMLEGAEQLYQHAWDITVERAQRGEGTFTLTQYQRFYREIMIGEEVSVHARLLDCSSKIIHGMLVLFNRSTGEVASTNEFVDGFVDLRTRKIVDMPDDVAAILGETLEAHRRLEWRLPLSERLGVRR